MTRSLDFDTVNQLIELMKYNEKTNPIESDYISMILYDYLYKVNANLNVSDDFELPLSQQDIELIINKSQKYETMYKNFQLKVLLISLIAIISIFVIQFFVVKANLMLSLLVTLSLGLMDLYFLNKLLLPKYIKTEEKKIQKNVTEKTIRLCKKLK